MQNPKYNVSEQKYVKKAQIRATIFRNRERDEINKHLEARDW